MTDVRFAALESGANAGELREKHAGTFEKVRISQQRLVGDLRNLMEEISTAGRETWPLVVETAKKAGITDDDIRLELGASPSTVHRWLHSGVAPREGTRRLMKSALIGLLDTRIRGMASNASEKRGKPTGERHRISGTRTRRSARATEKA